MHVPDGFLNAATCAGTACVAAAGVVWAGREVKARWNDQAVPMVGVMSAFVFAGQMVNFPVAGGTSGHLLGGVLAAVFLGPWAGVMVLTTVLAVQCFFFQDGGVTALGANILNLALIGVLGGYACYAGLRRIWPSQRGHLVAVGVASWLSVVLASLACASQLALSGTVGWGLVLPAMAITHAIIGVGEALITVAVVSFVRQVRPDLIYEPTPAKDRRPVRAFVLVGLLASLGVVFLLAPFASSAPDGLERVAEALGFDHQASEGAEAPLPDYSVPGVGSSWLSTVLAGVIGTLLAFLVAWGASWALRKFPRRGTTGPQADAT